MRRALTSGVRVGGPGPWHLPAWCPQQLVLWVSCQAACVPGPGSGGRAATCCPVPSACFQSRGPAGVPPASLSQWGPFTPALLWVHGQWEGSWLGGRILGPRRSPPAVPPALGVGCLLQSRLLHLSPCLSAVQEVLAKKPLGKQT